MTGARGAQVGGPTNVPALWLLAPNLYRIALGVWLERQRRAVDAIAQSGWLSLTKAAELLRLPVSKVEADLKGPQADEDRRQ